MGSTKKGIMWGGYMFRETVEDEIREAGWGYPHGSLVSEELNFTLWAVVRHLMVMHIGDVCLYMP